MMFSSVDGRCGKCGRYKWGKCKGLLVFSLEDCPKTKDKVADQTGHLPTVVEKHQGLHANRG